MLRSSGVNVTFSVYCPTSDGETVCVCGSSLELGNWQPHKAVPLKRQYNTSRETWTTTVNFLNNHALEYRYLVCRIREAETEGDDCDVMVLRWETNVKPRKLLIPEPSNDLDENGVAEFGVYGGIKSVDIGWIHHETEVHLRLHSNPLRMWKSKYKQRSYRIKCTPIDLLNRDISYDDEESSHDITSHMSSNNQIFVYNLNNSEEAEGTVQPQFGSAFTDDVDTYLTFMCRTWEPDYIGYMFDIYYDDDGAGPFHQHVGSAHLLPVNLKELHAIRTIPINRRDRPIGELSVDYIKILPLKSYKCDLRCSYAKYWDSIKSLDVGHRGMGSSYTTKTKCAAIRENTIASLQEAHDHGADFVEFDVQLSQDKIPVIYHDYTVCMSLRKKKSDDHGWFQLPIQELSLEHLQSLHLDHISETKKGTSPDHSPKVDPINTHLFPTLDECFQTCSTELGFLIEVKYCMPLQNGRLEEDLSHTTERNRYVDCILHSVLNNAGKRKVILCSFDPDICIMLRAKQNRYPVMFICMESTNKDTDYLDRRTRNLAISMNFAHSQKLLGMSVQVASLQKYPKTVQNGKDLGLVMFGWVDHDIEESDEIYQLRNMGLAGVIYDRISEVKPKDNIFHMDKLVCNEIMSAHNITAADTVGCQSTQHSTNGTEATILSLPNPSDINGTKNQMMNPVFESVQC